MEHPYWQPLNYPITYDLTPEQIAETCEVAAARLEHRWTTGSWFTTGVAENGTEDNIYMCVEGALIAALWGVPFEAINMDGEPNQRVALTTCPVYDAVLDTVNREANEYGRYDGLASWNDSDDRTEQEVLDILHRTAKRVLGVDE